MPTLFNTKPDYRRLLTALRREIPDRVPFFEAYADPHVQLAALEDWPQQDTLPQGGNAFLDAHIRAAYYLGYDCLTAVTEAKMRWGTRVALCGGIDIDMLCRADEETLRKYIRRVLDICAPGGGYLFGSGNSIPNFIPPRAIRIMLEEGARWG